MMVYLYSNFKNKTYIYLDTFLIVLYATVFVWLRTIVRVLLDACATIGAAKDRLGTVRVFDGQYIYIVFPEIHVPVGSHLESSTRRGKVWI